MRFTRPSTLLLFAFFVTALSLTTAQQVRADDTDDADDYDETSRVVRVSLLKGEVNIQRNGSNLWERADVNMALVEGDVIATSADARAEIQFDARNFVRLDHDTVMRIVTLRDEGIALSVAQGTATLKLARFDRDNEYFEIDAPKSTIAAEKTGRYRLDVESNGDVSVTVRDDGRARIYSETSGFVLRNDRTATLASTGSEDDDWDIAAAMQPDGWDIWVTDRDQYLAERLKFENRNRYYDSSVWGAEELDSYGNWTYTNDYGWLWQPSITTIGLYDNWAPYRYGNWTWCPPYGWTWVGAEPWGWAPYHYGRWVYVNNNWCWAPRGYGYNYRHAWWRPALVAFSYVPTSYGEHICWYPLRYGQHDPRSRAYQRLTPLRREEFANLQRTNPVYLRAVSSLPADRFGRGRQRALVADTEIARRAIADEPVRGRLPVLPTRAGLTDNVLVRERNGTRALVNRGPDRDTPARVLAERPTGAAQRMAGVPLDNQLRRDRAFQGRPLRGQTVQPGNSSNSNPATSNTAGGTGVFSRPPRPRATEIRPPVENNSGSPSTNTPNVYSAPSHPRRDMRPVPGRGDTTSADANRPAPIERKPRPDYRPPAVTPAEPGSQQPRAEREPRVEPNERRYTPPPRRIEAPVENRREARPAPRIEPRNESRNEPRNESRPQSPPPRSETPRPQAPAPSSPPASAPSRQAPPSREAPPARVARPGKDQLR
jgi:hypothetical protein